MRYGTTITAAILMTLMRRGPLAAGAADEKARPRRKQPRRWSAIAG